MIHLAAGCRDALLSRQADGPMFAFSSRDGRRPILGGRPDAVMRRTKRPPGPRRHTREVPTAVDVIDRVLDRGIVIEYNGRVSVGGIDTLIAVDARYVVTSCRTHLDYAAPTRARLLGEPGALLSFGRPVIAGR